MTTRSIPAEAQPRGDFDELRERLLETINHVQCADKTLYILENVPEELHSSCIVLHRATVELDKLYDEFDHWYVNSVCRPKTNADREAQTAELARRKTPEERERFMANMLPLTEAPASPLLGAVEEQRSRLINVLGAVQCMRVAVRTEPPAELEGAIALLEDELQRIYTGLEETMLARAVQGEAQS